MTFAPGACFFPGRAYSPRPGFSLCPGSHCRRPSAAIPPQPGAAFSSFFQPRPGVAPKQARAGATPNRRRVFATAAVPFSYLIQFTVFPPLLPAGERNARPIKLGRAIFCLSGNCFTWDIALIARARLFHVEQFRCGAVDPEGRRRVACGCV